jgi:hypothetical protein
MSKLISLCVVTVMVMVAACGGDDPPSCQQAITHYYTSGCAFFNTSAGRATTEQEALSACSDINTAVPDQCRGEFESWLSCIHDTPDNASGAQCDCTQESDALFACD